MEHLRTQNLKLELKQRIKTIVTAKSIVGNNLAIKIFLRLHK